MDRNAKLGDRGVILGMEYLGPGSGGAFLLIETKDQVVGLFGDHRPISHIVESLLGMEVEVVPTEFGLGVEEIT